VEFRVCNNTLAVTQNRRLQGGDGGQGGAFRRGRNCPPAGQGRLCLPASLSDSPAWRGGAGRQPRPDPSGLVNRALLAQVHGQVQKRVGAVCRDLLKIWQKMNAKRFDNIMLKTKTVSARALPEGIEVTFAPAEEGGTAPAPQVYDLVLQAVGRTPNGKKIAADKAGVAITDRGFINVDIQMRTNVPHIFAIGDIVGQPMLAHKAVHEAHVAAEVIAGELQGNKELAAAAFNARVIPSVAYTDPEVAWVGLTEDQAKAQGIKVKKGLFPWTASGRAIANGRDEGVTKLLFDDSPEAHGHGKILGRRHGRYPCRRHDRGSGLGD
jgi:hypothetical protein